MKDKPKAYEIQLYLSRLFWEHPNADLLYHNFEHTIAVAEHAMEMADYYSIDEASKYLLLSAAYFHDTGHLLGYLEGHEEVSVKIMRNYFDESPVTEEMLKKMEDCILATKWPTKPGGLLEEIMCDADTYHLGTRDFMDRDKRVWDELELRTGKPVSDRLGKSIRFMEMHRYYTEYCQSKLGEGKQRNLEWLRSGGTMHRQE